MNKNKRVTLALIFLLIFHSACFANSHTKVKKLKEAIVAEDTSGDYYIYCAIASVVYNRLKDNRSCGLLALKRKDLDSFVSQECAYALNVRKINLLSLSQKAIDEAFSGKDYSNGATLYEHTGVYGTPKKWQKAIDNGKIVVVKTMYAETKKEITFYRERR